MGVPEIGWLLMEYPFDWMIWVYSDLSKPPYLNCYPFYPIQSHQNLSIHSYESISINHMEVSLNRDTPKSSMFIGFSITYVYIYTHKNTCMYIYIRNMYTNKCIYIYNTYTYIYIVCIHKYI